MTETNTEMTWSLVVASNCDEVLQTNLLRPGSVDSAKEIIIRRNAPSAATAYNAGLSECSGDVVVFAHQDVFLPPGWAEGLLQCVAGLTEEDPKWGVLGLFGVTRAGQGVGHVYSTGLRRFVGGPYSHPVQVSSLDEMCLILQRTNDLRFDEQLPGFHLYGTDICLEAQAMGLRSYVVPCFALHNSYGIKRLPWSFWQAYLYLRNKWRDQLPILTPCTRISKDFKPIIGRVLQECWSLFRGMHNPGCRVADPEDLFLDHLVPALKAMRGSAQGLVSPFDPLLERVIK